MPKVTLDPTRQTAKDIDAALRKLKKKVEAAGTLKKLHEKSFYERPGITKNKKKAAAVMRQKRLTEANKLPEKKNGGYSK